MNYMVTTAVAKFPAIRQRWHRGSVYWKGCRGCAAADENTAALTQKNT